MRFGPVDIDAPDLPGSILAHTLRLRNGEGAIKKGKRLGEDDLRRLRQSGYAEVTVATLEAGDLHEDDAATTLAAGLVDASVRTSEASTGRCNLHASERGLLEVDAQRIDAFNGVSESITVATLPDRTLVHPDSLVATVKIIPFGVPEADVKRCVEALEGPGALRVAPLGRFDAGLVLTELPGVSQALLERASRAQRARLEALGSRVRREIRCQHTPAAVARALEALRDEGCDPILLLGASAIVDRGDVIPAGLREAGGRIVHLGMPVDPGNLLMVGALDAVSVFGLPGCARSLNPSGFDQVLQRHFAGESIDPSLISGLGVGGLLKEVPGRPMPRRLGRPSRAAKHVAAIVLAAGESRRMGEVNKLTLPVEGVPMVAQVADSLAKSSADEVIVVTGHEADQIEKALVGRPVRLVHNGDYAEGIGSSIRAGVAALPEGVDGVLIALADMPWVDAPVLDRLVDAFNASDELTVFVPMFGRKRGNPVLWASTHFPELSALSGDVGGKALFHRHADSICYVDVESAAVNIDVDTPEVLHALGIDGEPDPTA